MAGIACCATRFGRRYAASHTARVVSGYGFDGIAIAGRGMVMERRDASGGCTLDREIVSSAEERLPHPSMYVSLEEQTDGFLNRVPIGSMTEAERSRAQSLLLQWAAAAASGSADFAEAILERLFAEQQQRHTRNNRGAVSTAMYNVVLDAWSTSNTKSAMSRAEQLLSRMQRRNRPGAKPDVASYNSLLRIYSAHNSTFKLHKLFSKIEHSPVQPDTATFHILIDTYANRAGCATSAQRADDLLLRILDSNNQNSVVHATTRMFNTVLKAWKHSDGGIATARRAEQILRIMVQMYNRQDGSANVRPDVTSFLTVIHSYANYAAQEARECATRAVDILIWMQDVLEGDNVTSCFNAAMHLLVQSGIPNAGERATHLLEQMLELHDSGKLISQPDIETYTYLIDAWTKSQGSVSLERARAVLQDMIDGKAGVTPNAVIFNTLISAYCNAGKIKQAEELFQIMKNMAQEDCVGAPSPDRDTYHILIDYYCKNYKASNKYGPQRGVELLQDMEQAYTSGIDGTRPESYLYSALIKALSKSDSAPKFSYDVLQMMEEQHRNGNDAVRPDTNTYNDVLSIFAKDASSQSIDISMNILQRMNKMYKDDGNTIVEPNMDTYTILITTLSLCSDRRLASKRTLTLIYELSQGENKENRMLFDGKVCKLVLQMLATKKNNMTDARASSKVLNMMTISSKTNGNERMKPNTSSYNWVLKAYANSGPNAAERTHDILLKMIEQYREGEIDTVPDRIGFNIVIDAWAKSKSPKAVSKAELLVKLMKELHTVDGIANMEPDRFTSAGMIQVLSNQKNDNDNDSMESATRYFDQMEYDCKDVVVYNSLLTAFAKSNHSEKAQKSLELLKKMKFEMNTPNIMSYNNVLTACAFARGDAHSREKAWKIASQIFHDVLLFSSNNNNNTVHPNEFTLRTMMKACKHLSTNGDDERFERIQFVFERCRSLGLVSVQIIKEIRSVLDEEQGRALFGKYTEQNIPNEWTRNLSKGGKQ